MLESKIASGKTKTTSLGETYDKNLRITSSSRSFPASSVIYIQTDWKRNINIKMQNAVSNVLK